MGDRIESQLAGQTLADRYDILELIGAGGMGAVYRARDRELDEHVALKVIRHELATDDAIIERFRREVKLARRVTHANVARTFELGHADGVMFCTMELVEGESLSWRLRRAPRLPVAEAVAIACALSEALAAAHAVDVIHRDIKPDNVLIARGGRIVLADFGIASIGVDGRGDLSGTPAYMAPEQALGEPPTPATDVYAVGTLLFEMLTGTPAFAGALTQILADKQAVARLSIPPSSGIDPELADVIAAATEREVGQRIASAATLHARLTRAVPQRHAALVPHVAAHAATELRTVVVLAPLADRADARLYLADAVHEELLRRLSRRPRLRVRSRASDSAEPGATVVTLFASDVLTVRVAASGGSDALTLRLPLAADQIGEAAAAAASAIGISMDLDRTPAVDPATEPLDLLLRARHDGQRDIAHIADAIERLERAHVLLPEDPRIIANLAMLQVRHAFFATDLGAGLLARSRELVRAALAAAPRLAESHLAAGHVEFNVGDAQVAAGHYRVAIACAPHLAESHACLGRMLLEAGFLDRGLARLDEALAIAPSLDASRWDIARAFALEERWEDHGRIIAELEARRFARPGRSWPLRLRFALWRRDLAAVAALREDATAQFDAILPTEPTFAVLLQGAWSEHRDLLVARVLDSPPALRRRRAFLAQLVAETAGFAGDLETSLAMIAVAIDDGLFDLHWLDRCPLLAPARATHTFAQLRARVQARAGGILDALYGDHTVLGISETVAASRP